MSKLKDLQVTIETHESRSSFTISGVNAGETWEKAKDSSGLPSSKLFSLMFRRLPTLLRAKSDGAEIIIRNPTTGKEVPWDFPGELHEPFECISNQ